MEVTLIILSIVFSIISGFAKAICDLSEEYRLKFKPKKYWLKELSWENKWKNGKERFWGSSRWFVALTDAWHLFGLIERIGFVVTYTITGYLIYESAWHWFLLLNYPIFFTAFHIFYNSKILTR
jgi:hypothetical protein